MEESIINQNDTTIWYENDQLIQQYLNRSMKDEDKRDDAQVNNSSILKIINTSKGKR